MTEAAIGPLYVIQPKVVPFDYARTCHAALCAILHEACEKAIARGVLEAERSFHIQRLARQRNSGTVRHCVEIIIALTDRRKQCPAHQSYSP